LPLCGTKFLIQLCAKTCRYTDCKMCARLQISFVFLHILARETVLHFMRHFSRCIPLGSWSIKGIEPSCSKWGDFAFPKTPSTNPMRFGCAQAVRRLTTNKRACLLLCNPSLYPRDQPSADWIPPFHEDHKGASPPLWIPPTKGLFAPL
jgi:hypothetical protein